MAKRRKRSVSRRATSRSSRSTRLPMLLAVLAVSVLVSAGVIVGSLYQGDVSVLGSHTKNAKNNKTKKNAEGVTLNLSIKLVFPEATRYQKKRWPSTHNFTATVYTNNGKKLVKSAQRFTLNVDPSSGPMPERLFSGSVGIGTLPVNANYQVFIASQGFTSYTYRMHVNRGGKQRVTLNVPQFSLKAVDPATKNGNKGGGGNKKNNKGSNKK